MMKKIFQFIFLPALIAAAAVGCLFMYVNRTPFAPADRIVSPLWSRPAVAKQGGDFNITVASKNRPKVEKVTLLNSRFPDDIEFNAKVKTVVAEKESGKYTVTVTAPANAPESLYDLNLWYQDGQAGSMYVRQPGAVRVVRPRDGTFTFAVSAGLVFRNALESDAENLERTGAFMDELGLMNPDFVVDVDGVAGGVINANRDAFELYEMKERRLDAPVYFVPNGFDLSGLTAAGMTLKKGGASWRSIFGASHFSFDYEGFRFVGVDSYSCGGSVVLLSAGKPTVGCIGKDEFKWFEGELAGAVRGGLQIVVFIHHEPTAGVWTDDSGRGTLVFETASRRKFLSLCAKYNVQSVFSGHIGRDSVHWEGGTLFVSTGAGGGTGVAGRPAFRLVTVRDGLLDTRFVSYIRDPDSVPIGKTSVVYRQRDKETYDAVMSNGLARPLNNVFAAIRVAKLQDGAYEVKADGCRYVEKSSGRKWDYVFAACDLLPGEKKTVSVKPAAGR